ncbi:MutS-like protein, partial [Cichlidogyrus casuarinus]
MSKSSHERLYDKKRNRFNNEEIRLKMKQKIRSCMKERRMQFFDHMRNLDLSVTGNGKAPLAKPEDTDLDEAKHCFFKFLQMENEEALREFDFDRDLDHLLRMQDELLSELSPEIDTLLENSEILCPFCLKGQMMVKSDHLICSSCTVSIKTSLPFEEIFQRFQHVLTVHANNQCVKSGSLLSGCIQSVEADGPDSEVEQILCITCPHYENTYPYLNIKKSNSEFFRFVLLKFHYRVEIYTSATKSGRDNEFVLSLKGSPGNLVELEDLLGTNEVTESPGVIALNLVQVNDQVNVSLAYCNPETREFNIAEFIDCIQLTSLESLLLQCEAKECLVPPSLMTVDPNETMSSTSPVLQSRIDQTSFMHFGIIFERTGILLTEIKKSEISHSQSLDALKVLLKPKSQQEDVLSQLHLPELNCPQAIALINPIVNFLSLKTDSSLDRCFTLKRLYLDLYMKLDGSAIKALHLLPSPEDMSKSHSLYGVLNRCRTPQGQRLLAQWTRQPLTDPIKISKFRICLCQWIDERLDLVETILGSLDIQQGLHDDFLRRMPDLQKLARKLQRRKASLQELQLGRFIRFRTFYTAPAFTRIPLDFGTASLSITFYLTDARHKNLNNDQFLLIPLPPPQTLFDSLSSTDLYRLYEAIQRVPVAIDLLSRYQGVNKHILQSYFIGPLKQSVSDFTRFLEMIAQTIDMDAASKSLEFRIRADFDETLRELNEQIDLVDDELVLEAKQVAQKLDLDYGKTIKLDVSTQMGKLLRVTKKEEKALRDFKSLEIVDAPKGIVRFQSGKMAQLNSKLLNLKCDYNTAQKGVIDEVIQVAAGYVEPIYELNQLSAFLDAIISLAVVAGGNTIPYVRPKVVSEEHNFGRREIKIVAGRHPCLEQQPGTNVIANDCHFRQ